MPTQRILVDSDFDRIVIRTHRLARNVTMRVKSDGLYLTVPPYSKTTEILKVLLPYREKLLDSYNKIRKKLIDYNYCIESPCFRLYIRAGHLKQFTVREEDEIMYIYCPELIDFSSENVQKLLRAAIIRAMKRRAAACLPPLLAMWAERFGFTYKKVRINAACSRWGSCSTAGTISLSCYLMLIPSHLIDYVLLHELTHTKEMNHGPEFWKLMNQITEDSALLLRSELRNYHTGLP